LCPFHKEKTPSFSINPDGYFYCFGCKASGNAVTFIQKFLNYNFVETIKYLAEKYGIQINYDTLDKPDTIEQITFKLYDMTKYFFCESLRVSDNLAKDYFKERGINEEMISIFELGYSPAK
jgi:DNA primase